MKTRFGQILILILVTNVTGSAMAQATFTFANIFTGMGLDAPVFDAQGSRLSGNDYLAVLYGGPTMTSLSLANVGNSVMPPVGFTYVPPSGQAGYFFLGGGVEIDSVPCGGTPWLQVRAWDARLGSSYEAVEALGEGGYGESNIFQKQGGDPCVNPMPNQPLLGLQSFSLRAEVPEPSTWLLFLLGIPVILFRKRLLR